MKYPFYIRMAILFCVGAFIPIMIHQLVFKLWDVSVLRAAEITCGHFVADDGTTQNIKHNRMSELMDILEEVEGKAIIWAHWQDRDWETQHLLKL